MGARVLIFREGAGRRAARRSDSGYCVETTGAQMMVEYFKRLGQRKMAQWAMAYAAAAWLVLQVIGLAGDG
jgi:hypothetical protein